MAERCRLDRPIIDNYTGRPPRWECDCSDAEVEACPDRVESRPEVCKIAAWIPVTEELLRWFDPEPVHVEGGRCLLMAAAYGARPFSERGES